MRHAVVFAFALLPTLIAGTGCLNSCEQLCYEESRYIDGCLETWDALWPDLGYDGIYDVDVPEVAAANTPYDTGPAGEYLHRCTERYASVIYYSTPESGRDLRVQCSARLRSLAITVGCNDYQPGDNDLDPNGEDSDGVPPRPTR